MKLNEQQQAALAAKSNVVLVVAGAGSGKTTLLTQKIKQVISEDNIKPWQILAITFTNNAAGEIKSRVPVTIKDQLNCYTFHGFGAMLLRRYNEGVPNYTNEFKIIDAGDQRAIIKELIPDEDRAKKVLSVIRGAKGKSLTPLEVESHIQPEFKGEFQKYNSYMIANNLMDFDDLLLYVNALLDNQECRDIIADRYKYILIDEYQDTSKIQDIIIKKIKNPDTRMFIVGDVDQAIYEWRGAHIDNLLSIEDYYSDCEVVKLEYNYRSNPKIIEYANNLIKYNQKRHDKTLIATKKSTRDVTLTEFATHFDEADYVVNQIKYLKEQAPDKTICVLYRAHYLSKAIEDKLISKHIPYQVLGGQKFYERTEIKDAVAFLSLMHNPGDNLAFLRVINTPKRGVGEKTLELIKEVATDEGCSYFQATQELKQVPEFTEKILSYNQKPAQDIIDEFDEFLEAIGYYQDILKREDKTKLEVRRANIQALIEDIKHKLKTTTLGEVLASIALLSINEEIDESLVLSTVHGVKGMEFDTVFMVGLNQGLFPSEPALKEGNIEEERRICYVAITRARENLYITYYNQKYERSYLPSEFIEQMGLELEEFSI